MAQTAGPLDEAIVRLEGLLARMTTAAPPAPSPSTAAVAPQHTEQPSAPSSATPAAASEPSASSTARPSVDPALFAKVKIQVARLLEVAPLEGSSKLYVIRADLGGGDVRQICAGLQAYVPASQLAGRLVTVVANLKAAKLAGQLSQAMVLCAEHQAAQGLLVRTLLVPDGSEPGDVVFLDGGAPPETFPATCKSDVWKAVLAGLYVANGQPTFCGKAFATSRGQLHVPPEIPDGSSLH